MKKFIIFIGFIALFVILINNNPTIAHYYNLFSDSKIYWDHTLYKAIAGSKDIEGQYKINIKYPELYAIGILKKKK
jgi:hypothetical protein